MIYVPTTFLVLNGDLVGHMSFAKRKLIAKRVIAVTQEPAMPKLFKDFGFFCDLNQNTTLHLRDFSSQAP